MCGILLGPVERIHLLSVVSSVLVVSVAPVIGFVSAVIGRTVVLRFLFVDRLVTSKKYFLSLFEIIVRNM